MKNTFFGLLMFFLLVPLVTFAQSAQGTKIASINVGQVQVHQTGKSYAISFTITNGSGVQTGLRYGIQLVQQSGAKQYLIDQQAYPESLTLRENDAVTKQITYTPPQTLSGSYQLYIAVYNNSGLPFTIANGDTVTLTGSSGITVQPETCTVQAGAMKGDINKTAILPSVHTKVTLTCVAKNSGTAAVTVQPSVETYVGSIFGSKAETVNSTVTPVSFSAGEQKTVTITIPIATVPKTYEAKVWLSNQSSNSNPVFFRYIIAGSIATIQNLSFDKDSYASGQTAQLSLFWNGSVSSAQLSATVTNGTGAACADAISQTITTKPITTLSVPITKSCTNPKVSMTLKDSNGTVLDQKDFSVQSKTTTHSNKPISIVLIGILVVALAGLYINYRKKKTPINPIVMLLIGIAIMGTFHGTTYADTYASGPNGDIINSVNLPDGGRYAPGASIRVNAQVYNSSSTTAYPVSLSVTNNNGTPMVFISDTAPVTLGAGQISVFYQYTFTNGVPNVAGTYPMTFRTGVNDNSGAGIQFGGGGPSSAPVQGGTLDTNVICGGGLTQAAPAGGETLSFNYKTSFVTPSGTTLGSYSCSILIPQGQTWADDYPGKEFFGPSGSYVQVTSYCYDAVNSSVPNNQSVSGVPSC